MASVAAQALSDPPVRGTPADGLAAGLLDLVHQAIFIADGCGRLVDLNEAAGALAGSSIDGLIGQQLALAFPLVDRSTGAPVFPLSAAAIPGCVAAELPGQPGEFRLDWREAVDTGGRPLVILMVIDETPGHALQQALYARETTDTTTGLLNRQQFEARLDVALATCRDRPDTRHALCHLDVDHFRLINDALGPVAGDRLLRELARTVAAAAAPGDAIGRIGDSCFGIIFDGVDVAEARRSARQIVKAISATGFAWDERSFDISGSVGIAEISASSVSTAELMRQSGMACLQAKQEGRGRIVVAGDMRRAALHVRQLAIGSSITEAIAAGQISLAAQDIVAIADAAGPARYFELLLRMSDGRGRVTSAGDLIAAAERFDLMRPVDRWVLDEALDRLGGRIAAIPDLAISINLSGSSLGDLGFLPYLLGTIARSAVDACALTFELTETAVMRHADAARRTIDALHHAGCRIALDDFGVGLSNFDYLQRFPVDVVKIDGRFVRDMLTRPRDAAIVESIVALARRLGAQTVVEHVETAELMARVTALGADFAQGYHLGRPRPFTAVLDEAAAQPAARGGAERVRRRGSAARARTHCAEPFPLSNGRGATRHPYDVG